MLLCPVPALMLSAGNDGLCDNLDILFFVLYQCTYADAAVGLVVIMCHVMLYSSACLSALHLAALLGTLLTDALQFAAVCGITWCVALLFSAVCWACASALDWITWYVASLFAAVTVQLTAARYWLAESLV